MIAQINELIQSSMNEWMNDYMNEYINKWMQGSMVECREQFMNESAYVHD